MGEIKSTLDIIMEKAKGFTVTEQEKKAFRERAFEEEVYGLLQKYLDGLMDVERFKEEIRGLGEGRQKEVREVLKKACMERIDPEAENGPILEVIESLVGIATQPISRIISEFVANLESIKRTKEKVLSESLVKKGISGSAIIPNIRALPEWEQNLSEIKAEFHERLRQIRG